ncbi:MAG: hypothetical protein OXP71_03170 [Candidatus Poribacteria bacterium]|nr:hypothetical protein [Candidatus Poribacteria bacterium]
MKFRLFPHSIFLILMVTCAGTEIASAPETNAETTVPEYEVDAKQLFGLGIKDSARKVFAISEFWICHDKKGRHNMYLPGDSEFGRTKPYFREKHITPIETYERKDRAYLSLYFTEDDTNPKEVEVGRVELTHIAVVSAEEAVKMLGYDLNKLIEHPFKHRNADTSNWFVQIDPYFHLIEIQWFVSAALGNVTQIRASVW